MEDKLLRFRHIAQQTIEELDLANQNLEQNLATYNKNKETSLHFAARNGQLLGYQSMIKTAKDKNPKNIHGWTPLHYAAKNGYFSG